MSLVIALAGSREAVIGGDRRSIAFLGSCPRLEEELYSGQIKNDQELMARARGAGSHPCRSPTAGRRSGGAGICWWARSRRSPPSWSGAEGSIWLPEPACRWRSEREDASWAGTWTARPGSEPGAVWGASSLETGSPRSWRRMRSPGPGEG